MFDAGNALVSSMCVVVNKENGNTSFPLEVLLFRSNFFGHFAMQFVISGVC